MAKDNLFHEAEEDSFASATEGKTWLHVKVGEFVIGALRYACVSAGGTVFTSMGSELVVPVSSIVAYDLDLARLDTSRCSSRIQTGRVEKWQLSSEDHARVLRTVNESIDDIVALQLQM